MVTLRSNPDEGEREDGHWVVHSVYNPVICPAGLYGSNSAKRYITITWWPPSKWDPEIYDQVTLVNDTNLCPELARLLLNKSDEEFLSIGRLLIAD